MSFNCPVCNKTGLQDYRSNHVKCPQCNADLIPFMLLSKICKKSKIRKRYVVPITSLLCGITLSSLVILLLNKQPNKIQYSTKSASNDSTEFYKEQIIQLRIKPENIVTSTYFILNYKVKYGDNTSMLAKYFYGDWQKYKLIETDNNLTTPYTLKVGQILHIKLKN